MNGQRHRHDQFRVTAAHGHRVRAARGANDQRGVAFDIAGVQRQTTALATQRDGHALWRRDLQARPFGDIGRQVHRTAALWNGQFDRLNHLSQDHALGVFGQHAGHGQVGVGGPIHPIQLDAREGDFFGDVERNAAGVFDAQLSVQHQGLGVNHQTGVTQVDRRVALGLDDDAVAAQAQRAQRLIPHNVFDARDQLAIGQRDHVLGG